MSNKVTYTHKGWFGLCPIYISNPLSDGPDIMERIPYTAWLIDLSCEIYGILFKLSMTENPMWPIKVTGKLKSPVTVDYEDDDDGANT